MNKITLFGRLTRDPELRTIQGEKPVDVARFILAVDRAFRKGEADFIPCEVYGKRAKTICQYFRKGSRILLTGSLELTSKQMDDGSYRTFVNVRVNDFEFVDTKADAASASTDADDFVSTDEIEGLPFM